jgi:hypothetical protein
MSLLARTALAFGVAAAIFVAAPPAASSASSRGLSACQKLRGKDRDPVRGAKLVRRRNRDHGYDLLGCVLPRGRVRLVASTERFDTTSSGAKVLQTVGPIVLLRLSSGDQYFESVSMRVSDLRSGRHYTVASFCTELAPGACRTSDATTALVAFADAHGRAVTEIATIPDGSAPSTTFPTPEAIVTIAAFSSRGVRHDLDAGPYAQLPKRSLKLHGSRATWTHAGVRKSARLTG